MFTINSDHLEMLCSINSFEISESELIFFGLRGALPIDEDNNNYQEEHIIQLTEIDYVHPRCTIIQWILKDKKLAIFPGSTVPHKRYVQVSLEKNGEGTNRLMTGLFHDYRKGFHKAGKPSGHEAFRQVNQLPIRRTGDDLDYDEEDRVEFVRPFDNIHAAWCQGINYDRYASAGCQVIVGYPKCEKLNNEDHLGPWKLFHDNAYAIPQQSFTYILLNGRDAQKVSVNSQKKFTPRLRYGSKGELVGEVQQKLSEAEFYEGNVDNDFGPRTLFAILDFQTSKFGSDADDGIVGPITAGALNIPLV
jgi:hypothetical protein